MNETPSARLPQLALLAAAAGIALLAFTGISSAETAVKLPPARYNPAPAAAPTATAVFAGGCFWGVQAVFQHTQGVLGAVSGYSGGTQESARYEQVSDGATGHAEAVQITYDPKTISYAKLLQIFFSVAHDPTQLNRQGPDTGTQYRSAVFYANASQKLIVERYVAQLDAARVYPAKIVTQIAPLAAFYPAEAYHQDYATLNPYQPYIATFDAPKIESLKELLPEVFREKPVLVGKQ